MGILEEVLSFLYRQSLPVDPGESVMVLSNRLDCLTVPQDDEMSQQFIFIVDRCGLKGALLFLCSILIEERIVISGKSMRQISAIIDNTSSWLKPLTWQHTFVSSLNWKGIFPVFLHTSSTLDTATAP